MSWGVYGILIVFGAFLLLLILNPNLSCFGKRLKSPFYPLLRKKNIRRTQQVRTTDYGFHLSDEKQTAAKDSQNPAQKKAEDYGFRLD
jgi:hypothetical protein